MEFSASVAAWVPGMLWNEPLYMPSPFTNVHAADSRQCTMRSQQPCQICWYRVAFISGIDIRTVPQLGGPRLGVVLPQHTTFAVSEALPCTDGRIYLRLADGSGWVFDDSALIPDDPSVVQVSEDWMSSVTHVSCHVFSNTSWMATAMDPPYPPPTHDADAEIHVNGAPFGDAADVAIGASTLRVAWADVTDVRDDCDGEFGSLELPPWPNASLVSAQLTEGTSSMPELNGAELLASLQGRHVPKRAKEGCGAELLALLKAGSGDVKTEMTEPGASLLALLKCGSDAATANRRRIPEHQCARKSRKRLGSKWH